MIKSMRTRWAQHVARTETYKILVVTLERKIRGSWQRNHKLFYLLSRVLCTEDCVCLKPTTADHSLIQLPLMALFSCYRLHSYDYKTSLRVNIPTYILLILFSRFILVLYSIFLYSLIQQNWYNLSIAYSLTISHFY
jgi:hypothetical protein